VVATIRVNPDHLDEYVSSSQRLNEVLRERTDQLLSTYASVASEWQWGTVDATSALSALATFVQLNDADDAWVAVVAAAFRELDAHFPDGVPASVIEDVLAQHGLDGGRDAVTFDDPSATGLPLSSGWANDPVATATGHLAEVEVDLPLPERFGPLRVARVYSSRHRRPGAFGRGWSSWLDAGLTPGDGQVEVTFPDGRRVTYVDIAGQLTATTPCRTTVTRDGSGYRLAHPDGDRWELDPDGRLITVRSGRNEVRVERDDDGRVVALRHRSGRAVEVDWLRGRVGAVRSSDGRRIAYSYDGAGDLVAVDGPTGSRSFELGDDGLIVAAWDPDGVLRFRNTYDDQGRVTTQESSFGRVTRFAYLRPGVTVVDDDAGGPRTTFVHDDAGRLVGVIDDLGSHQTTRYDAAGDAVASMDRDGAVTTRLFDAAGRPVRIEGPDGAVVQLAYDGLGRLVRRVGPDGAVVELAYEGDARQPVRVTDPLGSVTTCELDDLGEIVAVTDPDGVTSRFERDADGQVVAVEASDGARMTLELDTTGEVVGVVAADGSRTAFTRDAAGHVTSRTTPDGATTRWERSPAGRVTTVTSPTGAVSRLTYGDHGELAELVDPTGVRVGYGWDVLGQLTRIVDPNGGTTEHRYDALSRLVATTDASGRTWTREHDATGRVLASVSPGGARSTRTYDAAGRLASVTDPLGATTRFDYDVAGRLVSVVDPLEDEATFVYDAAGRRVRAVDADGGVTSWRWTPAGRLAEVATTPADDAWPGRVERFRYDAAGRLQAVTSRGSDEPDDGARLLALERDVDGEVVALVGNDGRRVALLRDERGRVVGTDDGTGPGWRTEFDHAGRPVSVTGPDGASSRFGYDGAGRLDRVVDPLGGVTRFQRDATGLLTGATDPAGGTQRYEHDAAGRLVAFTDALGRRTEVLRDDDGRGAGHTDPAGGTQRLTRDPAGRIVGVTESSGRQVRIEFDAAGRPSTLADDAHLVELGYDRAGRLTRRSIDGRTHTYARDGRRFTVTDPAGVTTVYERDRAGRVVAIDHPVAGHATLTRDQRGRPLRLVAPQLERRWTWDDRGRLSALEQTVGDRTTRQRVERDDTGRIVTVVDDAGTTHLDYDRAGQLTELALPDGRSWSFTYEHGRRIAEVGPDGTERRFRYDPAGQLIAVDGPDGTTRLVHDDLGRRVRREDPGGGRVGYRWGAGGRLAAVERTSPDGTATTTSFTVDPAGDLIAVDGVALDWDHATGLPRVDRIGDTSLPAGGWARVDADTGAAWPTADVFETPAELDLLAALGLTPSAVPVAGQVGLGMRGEVTVDGLVWLRARVFDPDTGTFLSPDPLPPLLGGAQVANPYHLAANDPVHRVDPWGLQPLTDADLAAFNDQASRGLPTRVGDGFSDFAADPGRWLADNWEGVATVGLVVVGGVLIATGVGAPIGVGLIAGAAISTAGQIAMTGEVDGRTALISTLAGGVSGGVGGLMSGSSLVAQVGVGALADGTISAGSQYALTGTVDPAMVALDSAIGGTAAGAGGWLSSRGIAGAVDDVPVHHVEVSNPLPADGRYARVVPARYAEDFATGKGTLGGSGEVFVTAAEDVAGVTTPTGAAERLALYRDPAGSQLNTRGDVVVEFTLQDPGRAGIASPIETSPPRDYGFVHGGRTGGGAREWVVANGTADELGATDVVLRQLSE
jgi:RHS repeat-associated protein